MPVFSECSLRLVQLLGEDGVRFAPRCPHDDVDVRQRAGHNFSCEAGFGFDNDLAGPDILEEIFCKFGSDVRSIFLSHTPLFLLVPSDAADGPGTRVIVELDVVRRVASRNASNRTRSSHLERNEAISNGTSSSLFH